MKKLLFYTPVRLILPLCLFFTCQAQQKANASLEEAKKAIAASNLLYFQAFAKGDSSLFIGRYTRDCWIMPPTAPTLCGPDAPLELFKTAYVKYGLRNGRFITADVFGDGVGFVTEEGFWESYNAGHQLLDKGTFLVLWKKTPDGWKMFRHSFHSDREK